MQPYIKPYVILTISPISTILKGRKNNLLSLDADAEVSDKFFLLIPLKIVDIGDISAVRHTAQMIYGSKATNTNLDN